MERVNLKALSQDELQEFVCSAGLPAFRARQLAHWMYERYACAIDEITELSKRLREELSGAAYLGKLDLIERRASADGTMKYLFGLTGGESIESVLMPEEERLTLCISSQVGCAMGCRFCLTGAIGFRRNLTAYEIVDQVLSVSRDIMPVKLTNVVLMGMGEPLAATRHVCEFYEAANEIFFAAAKDLIDGLFFGNDSGTQRGLIFAPRHFEEFILPWIERFAAQAHRHGYQVILHSCGSVHDVVDLLIGAGVECLHPLQAKADRMQAEGLAREFGGRITFFGGIDTQEILVRGTPQEVKEEVRRVRDLLGPHLIVSPSHEAILPDVPPANIAALAEAAAG